MSDILQQLLGNKADQSDLNKTLSMVETCAKDLEQFARYFFPEYFTSEWSSFHYDMVNYLQDIILNRQDVENKFVVAAPRGHSKSTIFTFLCVMWCCCYGYKKVILVISATNSIAKKFILDCRTQLETNERIVEHFGNLKGYVMWSSTEFCTSNGVYVGGRGAGEQMRGFKWNGSRVDLCLIDDLESKENVATQNQRDSLEEWFTGDVMPMGTPTCDFLYVGTILSYEALLFKLLHEPRFSSWERKLYSAVIKDSESLLWMEFERIALDPTREKSIGDACDFFEEHRAEMMEGVELLWEKRQKDMYLYLRIKKLENEEKYNSEFQNNPMTENLRTFKNEWLENNYYIELPEIKEVFGALDPSMGKRKGDTSAIIMLGRGIDNRIYVLEADVCRRSPDKTIDDLELHIIKYYDKLKGFVVETNVMQEYLADNIKKKFLDKGLYVDWIDAKPLSGDSKKLRINGMVPKIKHGYVKFNRNHVTLLTQLKNYPKGNDDAPDTLQMALAPMMSLENSSFSFGSVSIAENKGKNKTRTLEHMLNRR
jgi:predicted phage terminase large subunit-like protein